MPTMIEFWNWLKKYAEQKQHNAWLEKHYCDQKCQYCETWQGTVGGWRQIARNHPTDRHDSCTCNKCGQVSVMLDIGVGFIAVEPKTLEPLD